MSMHVPLRHPIAFKLRILTGGDPSPLLLPRADVLTLTLKNKGTDKNYKKANNRPLHFFGVIYWL